MTQWISNTSVNVHIPCPIVSGVVYKLHQEILDKGCGHVRKCCGSVGSLTALVLIEQSAQLRYLDRRKSFLFFASSTQLLHLRLWPQLTAAQRLVYELG